MVKHCPFTIGNQIYPFTLNLKLADNGRKLFKRKNTLAGFEKTFCNTTPHWILDTLSTARFVIYFVY